MLSQGLFRQKAPSTLVSKFCQRQDTHSVRRLTRNELIVLLFRGILPLSPPDFLPDMCRNMSKMPLGANFGAVFRRLVTDLVPFSRFGDNVVTRFYGSDSRSFFFGATSGAVFLCLVPKVASFRRFGANCGTSNPVDRLHFSLLGEGIVFPSRGA